MTIINLNSTKLNKQNVNINIAIITVVASVNDPTITLASCEGNLATILGVLLKSYINKIKYEDMLYYSFHYDDILSAWRSETSFFLITLNKN